MGKWNEWNPVNRPKYLTATMYDLYLGLHLISTELDVTIEIIQVIDENNAIGWEKNKTSHLLTKSNISTWRHLMNDTNVVRWFGIIKEEEIVVDICKAKEQKELEIVDIKDRIITLKEWLDNLANGKVTITANVKKQESILKAKLDKSIKKLSELENIKEMYHGNRWKISR